MTTAYCFHCRKKREIDHEKSTRTSTGKKMVKGKCSKCGGRVSSFISSGVSKKKHRR